MFPNIKECISRPKLEVEVLSNFDMDLREALIRLRAATADLDASAIDSARVTVLLSVAADAALAAKGLSDTTAFDSFIAVASDAFEWATEKRRACSDLSHEGRAAQGGVASRL
jgi:hypothetical protein